jgi:chromosomal replication initiation ATPase DnaA
MEQNGHPTASHTPSSFPHKPRIILRISSIDAADEEERTIKNPFVIPGIKKLHVDPQLNPDYSFANFVEGDCIGWLVRPALL